MIRSALGVLLAVSSFARADDGGWETVASGALTIKTRAVASSPVREVWAERDVAASAQDLGQAISDVERFPRFMPYVKEARFLGEAREDGSRIVYTALALPMIAGRDFVIADRMVQPLNPDGSGQLIREWRVVPDLLPSRSSLIRLKTNTGSWHVTPTGEGKCHVVYRFAVDPGGAIPPFLADLGNRTGVPGVFSAIEKEAQRLQKERAKAR